MGGWGKLSLASIVFYLDGLPIPFVTVESAILDGLFAKGDLACSPFCSCFGPSNGIAGLVPLHRIPQTRMYPRHSRVLIARRFRHRLTPPRRFAPPPQPPSIPRAGTASKLARRSHRQDLGRKWCCLCQGRWAAVVTAAASIQRGITPALPCSRTGRRENCTATWRAAPGAWTSCLWVWSYVSSLNQRRLKMGDKVPPYMIF